jgi:hypothetical protein
MPNWKKVYAKIHRRGFAVRGMGFISAAARGSGRVMTGRWLLKIRNNVRRLRGLRLMAALITLCPLANPARIPASLRYPQITRIPLRYSLFIMHCCRRRGETGNCRAAGTFLYLLRVGVSIMPVTGLVFGAAFVTENGKARRILRTGANLGIAAVILWKEKMKRYVKKVPFAVWGAVFFAAVCAAPYAEENDTWIPVTRTKQIAGNWEGSTVVDSPAEEGAMIPASSMGVVVSLWYEDGADEAEVEFKLNFGQLLSDWSSASGLSESALWEIMGLMLIQSDGFTESELGDNVLCYSMTIPADELIAGEDGLYINTNGTKLRFGDSVPVEIGNFADSDLVMRRK